MTRQIPTRRIPVLVPAILAGYVLFSAACGKQATVDPEKLRAFAPLPGRPAAAAGPEAAKIALGRMLYYDARLSKAQNVSCNSCHDLSNYGTDRKPTSEGHLGQRGARNSPTVYNAAIQFVQFWDGRAPDVEKQAQGPLLNPIEMAMPSEKAVVDVLKSMPGYVAAFRRAFPAEKNPITLAHATEAIGAFERGLVTPSRWDRFLNGDRSALTPEEKAGLNRFLDAGCATCHSGALLGGNAYQKLGFRKDYPDRSDPGRYQVTKMQSDQLVFKVPPLRNVAMTGPYFHNGKVATLEDAVLQMAQYQTGKELTAADRAAIVTWLKCLTGDIDAAYIARPELPPSTSRTPRPKKTA